MTLRKPAAILAVSAASMLAVPVAAEATAIHHVARSAAATPTTTATSFNSIPVTGKAVKSGKTFTGHMTVTQFVTRNGRTMASGTLTGKLGNRVIKKTNVLVPVSLQPATSGAGSSARTAAVSCPVLNLVLGPLHLNLLGLVVDLNQVNLNITAVPGAGNLLGNLLCGVANLLNGTGATGATGATPTGATLTGLLNIVQQLIGTPSLLTL